MFAICLQEECELHLHLRYKSLSSNANKLKIDFVKLHDFAICS